MTRPHLIARLFQSWKRLIDALSFLRISAWCEERSSDAIRQMRKEMEEQGRLSDKERLLQDRNAIRRDLHRAWGRAKRRNG